VSIPLSGGPCGGDGAMGWGVCVFPVNNMERGEDRTTHTHTHTHTRTDTQTRCTGRDTHRHRGHDTQCTQFIGMPSKLSACSREASLAASVEGVSTGGRRRQRLRERKRREKRRQKNSRDSASFITWHQKRASLLTWLWTSISISVGCSH